MRWPSASVTACSCALLLAGCGGGDGNQRQPSSCTARAAAVRLQAEAVEAIRSHRVPPRYQEPLMSAANGLVARLSVCSEPTPKGGGKKHGKKKHEKND